MRNCSGTFKRHHAVPTSAEMGVNAHVASCTRQALVLAEWYVLLRRQVDVFFSKTKVNDMDNMLLPV